MSFRKTCESVSSLCQRNEHAMPLSFFAIVRGVEVEIFADQFDGDDSVGIPIGPEEVWAKTLEGQPFNLTDAEVERFGIEATEIYYDQE